MESLITAKSRGKNVQARAAGALDRLIGKSLDMWSLRDHVVKFAPLSAPVLVHGETGTGKELVARALHELSPRRGGPFVAVNCGGLSDSLLEDTFFGHEKGAFTGAEAARPGVFEQAHTGTLFLDEIGELPLAQQAALLRVLDHSSVRRVGGARDVFTDFRVVAATNRDLLTMAEDGAFRLDLYHRLAALEIATSPLRGRRDDIAPIAHHFLTKMSAELGPKCLSETAVHWLECREWPGNVRELKNVLYRTAALTTGEILAALDFEGLYVRRGDRKCAHGQGEFRYRIDAFTDRQILELLERHGGNVTAAARDLGVPRTTLRDRWRRIPRADKKTSAHLSVAC